MSEDHDSLFAHFDAWDSLFKARKAKGLDKWSRLKNLSEKLQGKDIKAISFTCCHPSHAGEPTRHLLGSVEGNLHFLLGYGNPSFHLAPYHWQVLDPNITDEEAVEMSKRMSHPSNPVLWAKVDFSAGDEGDLEEGSPHKSAKSVAKKPDARKGFPVQSAAGSYLCFPEEALVYGLHNGHYYVWDMVKDTFFAAQNPEVSEIMNSASVLKSLHGISYRSDIPDSVRAYTAQFKEDTYAEDVWSLVKSKLPGPGKFLKLESSNGETLYGVTTPTSLEFYDRSAARVSVQLFDRSYDHFDLTRDGNVPPAALFSFLNKHFKINTDLLSEVVNSSNLTKSVTDPVLVEGEGSPGWDAAPSTDESFEKSIFVDGEVLKVMPA